MPSALTYPGVYVEEIPSGVHTIKSVSTSVTAFIDFFREGPVDTAMPIFGMTDFNRIYGGLDARSPASYAIAQFFLNGGGEACVIRANRDNTGANLPLEFARETIRGLSAAAWVMNVLEVSAANQGVWGNNVRVNVDPLTATPAATFNMTVTRYDGPTANARVLEVEQFPNLTMTAGPRYLVSVVNNGSRFVRLNHLTAGTGNAGVLPAPNGTLSDDISGISQAALDALGAGPGQFRVAVPGQTLTCTFETWTAGQVTTTSQLRARFERAIQDAGYANDEAMLSGASVELVGQAPAAEYLLVRAGRGAANFDPQHRLAFSDEGADTTASAVLMITGASAANVQQYSLGQGTGINIGASVGGTLGADGDIPSAAELTGSLTRRGIGALDTVDLFNILCIPLAADLQDAEMTAVVSGAIAYCARKRAFMIVDIPEAVNDVQQMKDWLDAHGTFRHHNAAVYFPRPRIPDRLDQFRLKAVAASGTMAGVFARTDVQRGVWKAPAGIETTLTGVSDLATKLTDDQNGTLNPLGINCLRSFPIYGKIAWGTRTLAGADQIGSEWAYIPVRRLALMLEESLFRGTKWVVFEPNDERLWSRIRLNVGAYMQSLFRQGAFQNITGNPRDSFYVKCDRETTTQNDINSGIVNIEVGFAPLKPAEFVVIKIQQMRGDL